MTTFAVGAEYDDIDRGITAGVEVAEKFPHLGYDSGYGFGVRDVVFYTDSEYEAWLILDALAAYEPISNFVREYEQED